MIYCANCGCGLEDNAKFCNQCGNPVAAPVEPAYAAPVEPAYAAPVEPAYAAPVEPVYAAPVEPAYAAPVEPAYAAPVEQPYYAPVANPYAPGNVPYVEATPVVSTKDKTMGFVGMGLGIGGLFFAVLGLLYTLIGMTEAGVGFGLSVGFGIFSMPLSILGRKFADDSAQKGNTAAACSIGAKLGLAGLIVSCVMLFFGFINLFVA